MEKLMLSIQHSINPLQIYCRLIDIGLEKRDSMFLVKYYEFTIYKWLLSLTRIFISRCRSKQQAVFEVGGHNVL